MSIADPIQPADFWSKLRFAGRPEFVLTHYKQQSKDGGENILSAKLGQPKWRCDVASASGLHDADMDVQTIVSVLLGRNSSFRAYDIRRPYPLLDPGGSRISGFTPQINSIGANNRSLSIKGVPLHYNLSVGDKFSVGDGTHSCLLQAAETIGSGGDDTTAEFEVQPFLPTWLAINNTVDFAKPACKFKIVAGTYKPQSGSGNMTDGFGFSMISVP